MRKPALIFDLDNTLCECGQYYLDAKHELVERQFVRTGIGPEIITDLFNHIDLQATKLERGFSRDRFPRSFSATSAVLDIMQGREPDSVDMAEMWNIGNGVFEAPYTLYEGVESTLQAYKAGGWKLILCSKGEDEVQARKVRINRLERFFPEARTYFTLVKSLEHVRHIIAEQQVDVARSWYIGDSMRDDIGPALAAGLRAVEVQSGTGKWAYENVEHPPTAVVKLVRDLPGIIPVLAPGQRKTATRARASGRKGRVVT